METIRPRRRYDVVALEVPIAFNKWGDHDHNGLLFALETHKSALEEYRAFFQDANDRQKVEHRVYPLVRPLVLRACVGEEVEVRFTNHVANRHVGMHLIADGYDVASDGARVGANPSSLAPPGGTVTYRWRCDREGVFVFHDAGNYSGMEDGTNLHGLFGALVVEPAGTTWRDPVSGEYAVGQGDESAGGARWLGDGLYVDVVPDEARNLPEADRTPWLDKPVKYPEGTPGEKGKRRKCFREYVIFFHDEVEYAVSHEEHAADICHGHADLCGNVPPGEHPTHPLMTISYRAEPMVARQRELWRRMQSGKQCEYPLAPVLHEEQHHSSWMFGDPATPILHAYIGDPVRIRLVHTAVKETHVFHLHLYSWHHDPDNVNSPLIDAISIGPQTGHTIVPLWGAGNRQGAPGDVIWHCHLYPHFHEGMWGMFRTFDRYQDGSGVYPDCTPIARLLPLPDRQQPTAPSADDPGFPNFIEGMPGQRSPLPPWIDADVPPNLDYRPPSAKELARLKALAGDTRKWINTEPIPGWMFNVFALPCEGQPPADDEPGPPARHPQTLHLAVQTQRLMYNEHCWHDPEGHLFRPVEGPRGDSPCDPPYVKDHRGLHELRHPACGGAHDGHAAHGQTPGSGNVTPEPAGVYTTHDRPLFFRANHGDVVTLELENRLPRAFCRSPFDEPLPPCEKYSVPVRPDDGCHTNDRYWKADRTPPMQCGQHVHLVKFDPLVCDGAATGWNYLSGPRAPYWDEELGKWRYLRMRYVWWADEEFGVVFTHDHLFANFRQKRGLFGAMLVEPTGATWHDPDTGEQTPEARFAEEAVIRHAGPGGTLAFREFCIALGDFVPLYDRHNLSLNPPNLPGGHSDHGVVGINYRSAPVRERTLSPHDPSSHDPAHRRRMDPAYAFSSVVWQDPDTPIFRSRPGDPIRIRLLQGSHEEQHSFQVHGMRWRRFRGDPHSPLSNQQTLGISEQFSFNIEHGYGPGDYLYKFGSADDLWMGAWGIIRVGDSVVSPLPVGATNYGCDDGAPADAPVRSFRVVAEQQEIKYCDYPPLSDPKGLVYRLVSMTDPAGKVTGSDGDPITQKGKVTEPLILRCRRGERVEVRLINKTKRHPTIEPNAPMVPVERFDRPVSERVSMHADLLRYDVKKYDGSNVGHNPIAAEPGGPDQTAGINDEVTYSWYADVEGSVLLQDFADFRNHRHHGLVGALIVEPAGSEFDKAVGKHAVVSGRESFEEVVVIIQDGLRLFMFGNLSLPMGDPPADPGQRNPDPTDQGQKAFNYRAQPVGPPKWLEIPHPATPVFELPTGARLRLRLVTAADKPRNHSFTVHGHAWPEWPTTESRTAVGSVTSLSCGSALTLEIQLAGSAGDYAYRSGVLRWAVPQGLWGILRLHGDQGKR